MRKKCYILLAIFIVVIYSVWYSYCHYFPLLESSSTDIVNKEYHFGDVNNTHLSTARKSGIKPIPNRDGFQKGTLTKIESCGRYKLEHLTYSIPYLIPEAASLLDEIGARFQQSLKEMDLEKHRIIVTSVFRTKEDVEKLRKVNGNASENSPHQYATTFDITYVRFDRLSLLGGSASKRQLANILGEVLKQLHNERRCYIKYERNQRCFHITLRV